MADVAVVRFPGDPDDLTGQTLLKPTIDLLEGLNLLEDPEAKPGTADGQTPESLQVIKSGALSLSQYEARIVKLAGSAGFLSVLGGVGTWFNGAHPATQAALVIGGSIIVVAALFATALIVRADVSGRATSTAAQYQARGAVASRFLSATEALSAARLTASTTKPPAPTSPADEPQTVAELLIDALGAAATVSVSLSDRPGQAAQLVTGLSDGVNTSAAIRLADGTSTPLSNVSGFNATFGGG